MESVVDPPVLGPAAELGVDYLDVPRQLVGPVGVGREVVLAAREQARDDNVGFREGSPDAVEEGGLMCERERRRERERRKKVREKEREN